MKKGLNVESDVNENTTSNGHHKIASIHIKEKELIKFVITIKKIINLKTRYYT